LFTIPKKCLSPKSSSIKIAATLKSKELGSNSKIRVVKPMIADGMRINQPIFLYLLGNR
jgi:hypothetical protein